MNFLNPAHVYIPGDILLLISSFDNNCMITKSCKSLLRFSLPLSFSSMISLGHLSLLLWFEYPGNKISKFSYLAVQHNQFDILKWLKHKNYPLHRLICDTAVKNGQLEILKWARENECPWNIWLCVYATKNGDFEILKWAIENGCPWNADLCLFYATESGYTNIVSLINSSC